MTDSQRPKLSCENLGVFRGIVLANLVLSTVSVLQCDLCCLILTLETALTKSPRLYPIETDSDHVLGDFIRFCHCCHRSMVVIHQNFVHSGLSCNSSLNK